MPLDVMNTFTSIFHNAQVLSVLYEGLLLLSACVSSEEWMPQQLLGRSTGERIDMHHLCHKVTK